MTCWHCRSRLQAGRCPGDTPLTHHDGHWYGTAAQIAHHLGPDITAGLVRTWASRSRKPGRPGKPNRLHGLLPAHHLPGRGRGTTWYRYDQAARVCALTEQYPGGRERGRVELTPAA